MLYDLSEKGDDNGVTYRQTLSSVRNVGPDYDLFQAFLCSAALVFFSHHGSDLTSVISAVNLCNGDADHFGVFIECR